MIGDILLKCAAVVWCVAAIFFLIRTYKELDEIERKLLKEQDYIARLRGKRSDGCTKSEWLEKLKRKKSDRNK